MLNLQFMCKGLKNKDGWFGKSDPFYTVSRINEDGTHSLAFKSEVVMDDLSPTFKAVKLQVQKICNGDYLRPIKIELWDWDKDGKHDTLGHVETSLSQLIEGVGKPAGRIPVQYKSKTHGTLCVAKADLYKVATLPQYLSGGMQFNLMVAVDYTGSNGNPAIPGTLHHIDPTGAPNQYQSAIASVGAVLQEYDTDKLFPIWGFGARIDGQVSHCFQVGPQPQVAGVGGLLEAYRQSFARGITMSGPTLFSAIIGAATSHAISNARACNGQSYSVLLILTDGIVNDMQATVDAIVVASKAPLSIVIVGVGPADFKGMEALDGDDGLLMSSSRKPAERDIVQFVPYSQFANSPSRLAAETLAEIPHQCVEYMTKNSIAALPPLPPPDYSQLSPPPVSSDFVPTTGGGGTATTVPRFFEFNVPPTAVAGSLMKAVCPEGKQVEFVVPEGCGGVLRLQY